MLSVAFLYLCFTGTLFLGSLILSQNHYPIFVGGVRFFGSGVILLTLYILKNKSLILKQLPKLNNILFFKHAFFLYTLSAIGFSWAMQYVDPVKGCFVFVLAPFVTALQLYFLKGEKLTTKKIIGLSIGFFAVIPIILQGEHGTSVQEVPLNLTILGYFVFICSVVAFAYGWILNKDMCKSIHLPSSLVTGSALIVGGGLTLFLFLMLQGHKLCSMQVTDDFWWLLLLFAILTAIAYNLYSSLLQRFSPTFIAFASFLEPAFGLLYAAVFLGQSVTMISFISLVGLGCGLFLFYQEELRLR
ncbi:MAG: DMT family transporter [Candidatus Dependentiae bacterium]|nr:DMT family transporter [Candidatus Dependentiae bacterium]